MVKKTIHDNDYHPNEIRCIHCKTLRKYSDRYDAYYCPKCLHWQEKICPDRKCEFCKGRPKYPRKNTQ